MTQVDNLTNAADQTTNLVLADNTVVTMRMRYRVRTQRWTVDVGYPPVTLGGKPFQVNGLTLTCFPNVMRPWRNLLPFGIGFWTADLTDPFDINDFSTGRVAAYLLSAADVTAIENSTIGDPA